MIDHDILSLVAGESNLSPLEWKNLFRRLRFPLPKLDGPPAPIPADICLIFWTEILLQQIPFISPDQIELIRSELYDDLQGVGSAFYTEITAQRDLKTGHQLILAFADGAHVTWNGRANWLDLSTGDEVDSPGLFVESVAYNLKNLFAANYRTANRHQSARNSAKAENARTTNDSADQSEGPDHQS